MKVLVTGGTGFVGSHTAVALAGAGHDVRLLARDPAKVERVFAPRALRMDDVVLGDVTDPDTVAKALDGCDAVVHAAAVVALRAADAERVKATNLGGVRLVVGGAHARGVPSIVYVSSLSALGRPGGPEITVDSEIARPRSAYAASKADGERAVRELQERGAPIRTCYPPGVVGPDDPGLSEANHAVRAFLKDLMVLTATGFCAVDVRDLSAIHARLVEHDAAPGRYLVPGLYRPWPEMVATMERLTGRFVPRIPVPGPLLRLAGRVGDAVKRVVDFDFPLTHEAMAFASGWPGAEMSPALAALGPRFRELDETYADTIRWLHQAGHLTARQAGRLAAQDAEAAAA